MVDAQHAPLATAAEGDSVTFRNGAPSSWKQEGYLCKVYLTLQPPEGSVPRSPRPPAPSERSAPAKGRKAPPHPTG